MAEHGMTPMQAIQASTLNAARLLHMDGSIGSLEVGKVADVIVLEADVLSDISMIANPDRVKVVLKGGELVKNVWEE
jgi:imidazolonepropionase-like amidohydrolase